MIKNLFSGKGRRRIALTAFAVLLVFGLVGVSLWATHRSTLPPQPAASVVTGSVPVHPTSQTTSTVVYPPNNVAPASLSIPSLGVNHALEKVGLNPDGTMAVPGLNDVASPAWYTGSPSPGSLGPAVIVGHVDSASAGNGVFFKLGAMLPGQEIDVTRTNGAVEHFTVTQVQSTPKASFPTSEVYGNTSDPELRVITCGGQFDSATGHYLNNIIVFAKFVNQTN